MARVRLQNVSKRFGSHLVVDDVSLDIADGEFLVLLGPSGCGKSTLLRMMAGLEKLTSGQILLDDRDITDTPAQQRDLAMVFQSYALYPHLTVAKNIAFPLRARKLGSGDIATRVGEVARVLGLESLLQRRPASLSGGQRQRVALARAMVRAPGAFLMDEPLSNLDAKLRNSTRTELSDLHRRLAATFVYVTHDQVEAMTMASRIVLLNEGRVEQVGSPEDLFDRPRTAFAASFLGSPPMNLFEAEIDVRDAKLTLVAGTDLSRRIELPLGIADDGTGAGTKVLAGVRPERLRLRPPSESVADAHPTPTGIIRAIVTMRGNLGSEELLQVRAGSSQLTVRAPRPVPIEVGEQHDFAVDPADIHLFDPASGVRLEWRTQPSSPATVSRVNQSSEEIDHEPQLARDQTQSLVARTATHPVLRVDRVSDSWAQPRR